MHQCMMNFDWHFWKKFPIIQNNLHFLVYFKSPCMKDQSPDLKLVIRIYVHFMYTYLCTLFYFALNYITTQWFWHFFIHVSIYSSIPKIRYLWSSRWFHQRFAREKHLTILKNILNVWSSFCIKLQRQLPSNSSKIIFATNSTTTLLIYAIWTPLQT